MYIKYERLLSDCFIAKPLFYSYGSTVVGHYTPFLYVKFRKYGNEAFVVYRYDNTECVVFGKKEFLKAIRKELNTVIALYELRQLYNHAAFKAKMKSRYKSNINVHNGHVYISR